MPERTGRLICSPGSSAWGQDLFQALFIIPASTPSGSRASWQAGHPASDKGPYLSSPTWRGTPFPFTFVTSAYSSREVPIPPACTLISLNKFSVTVMALYRSCRAPLCSSPAYGRSSSSGTPDKIEQQLSHTRCHSSPHRDGAISLPSDSFFSIDRSARSPWKYPPGSRYRYLLPDPPVADSSSWYATSCLRCLLPELSISSRLKDPLYTPADDQPAPCPCRAVLPCSGLTIYDRAMRIVQNDRSRIS